MVRVSSQRKASQVRRGLTARFASRAGPAIQGERLQRTRLCWLASRTLADVRTATFPTAMGYEAEANQDL